jgi:hypothetical protein
LQSLLYAYILLLAHATYRERGQTAKEKGSRGEIKGLEAMISLASDGRIKEVM